MKYFFQYRINIIILGVVLGTVLSVVLQDVSFTRTVFVVSHVVIPFLFISICRFSYKNKK